MPAPSRGFRDNAMVVRHAPTAHRKIRDGAAGDDDSVELLGLESQPSPHDFDVILESVRRESTLKSLSSTGSRTGYEHVPIDDDVSEPLRPKSTIGSMYSRSLHSGGLFVGWRFGALISLIGALIVCLINVVLTVWVFKNPAYKVEENIGILDEGNCEKIKNLDVWLHLLINVLSTLLLSASNYCMQVLSAPSREELVRAHARKYWLHIGVPSIRNLFRIGNDRAFLWLALFLTSVPLHLLLNSVVFTNLQANDYIVIPATEEWWQGGKYDTSGLMDVVEVDIKNMTSVIAGYEFIRGSLDYKRLDVGECFSTYDVQYTSKFGNLILIQDEIIWRNPRVWWFNVTADNNTWVRNPVGDEGFPLFEGYAENGDSFPFLSFPTLGAVEWFENQVPEDKSQWAPYGSPIKYCMAEQVDEVCKLQFHFPIAVAVIVANLVKAICIGITLFLYRRHAGLVTLGDTISSFLDDPDPKTVGRCLHTRALMEAEWNWERANWSRRHELKIEPEAFVRKSVRWGSAPSRYRWSATYILYTAAVIIGSVMASQSVLSMPSKDIKSLWRTGFGNVSDNNLLKSSWSLTDAIFLANFPQAILSYLYLAFNAFYTCMFVAREWFTYGSEHKPLRVTAPFGNQRSTYWLNVPFRYAVPMTFMSGLFHWLASQAIFMVQIAVTDSKTREVTSQISTVGYSPLAIIFTTVTATLIALGGIGLALRKYPPVLHVILHQEKGAEVRYPYDGVLCHTPQ